MNRKPKRHETNLSCADRLEIMRAALADSRFNKKSLAALAETLDPELREAHQAVAA